MHCMLVPMADACGASVRVCAGEVWGGQAGIFVCTLEFRQFVDDLCVKSNIECPPPRTASRLLDKVGVLRCTA